MSNWVTIFSWSNVMKFAENSMLLLLWILQMPMLKGSLAGYDNSLGTPWTCSMQWFRPIQKCYSWNLLFPWTISPKMKKLETRIFKKNKKHQELHYDIPVQVPKKKLEPLPQAMAFWGPSTCPLSWKKAPAPRAAFKRHGFFPSNAFGHHVNSIVYGYWKFKKRYVVRWAINKCCKLTENWELIGGLANKMGTEWDMSRDNWIYNQQYET